MTTAKEWQALVDWTERNTDPLGRVRIADAVGQALTFLPRRDCIRLVSSFIRRGFPLLREADPHARVARCVVELCEALSDIDDISTEGERATALAWPLDNVEGPWVGNLGRSVWDLWRAAINRSPTGRAKAAATALVGANMTIAGVAWAKATGYPPENDPVKMDGSDYYHMLFHPAYAEPWVAGWRELCSELRHMRPLAEIPTEPGAPKGEEPE